MPTPNFVYGKCVPRNGGKKKEKPDFSSFSCGGDSWTRTNDPIDVNDVLYRLSHATTLRFEVPTKVSSHHGRNYKPLSTVKQASGSLKSTDSAFRQPSDELLKTACVPLCVRRTQVPYTAVHNASRTQKWAPDFTLVPLIFTARTDYSTPLRPALPGPGRTVRLVP